jgi:WD40 repeat protein
MQANLVGDHHILTCSRDQLIKLWDTRKLDSDAGSQPVGVFTGHESGVTTANSDRFGLKMASGGRDCTTILWDVETEKLLEKRKVEKNVVTDLKWRKSSDSQFFQLSEDLTLRLYDIRSAIKLKPVKEFKLGNQIPTNLDLFSNSETSEDFLLLGHRGFNGDGSEVRLFDIRNE